MKTTVKKELIPFLFFLILFIFSAIMFFFGAILNSYFGNIFSNHRIIIQDLRIPFLGVIIAPINEEFVKFLGYIIIYLFGFKLITPIGYDSKKKFRDDYLAIAFLISAGGFGFFEGVYKNLGYGSLCFVAFILLNAMIHITFSIYPYLLGKKYKNLFIIFLPIAMLLHSFHNFVIKYIWDNKWVTFTMVTALLLPIIVMERKNFYKILERFSFNKLKNPKKVNRNIILLFVLLYCYIFLCVWLRFL